MNVSRLLLQLLSSYLLIWIPGTFAVELLRAFPSMGMRGAAGWLELAAHGLVAAWCAVAGRMIRIDAPSAAPAAAIGVVLRAAVSLQSLTWTTLPQSAPPGSHLPLALLAGANAAFWLLVIRRVSRR